MLKATITGTRKKRIKFDDLVMSMPYSGKVYPFQIWGKGPRYMLQGFETLEAAQKTLNKYTYKEQFTIVEVTQ